ncbi:unnamed protein product [Diamesa serratosioi]
MSLQDNDNIPCIDDDDQAIVEDDNIMNNINNNNMKNGRSMDSIGSYSSSPTRNLDELDEKARLISQVLELQNTLDDLNQRVGSVKTETLKLRSENQVLGQYIENLMSASSIFSSTSPSNIKKK